jgi:hypothetical protein
MDENLGIERFRLLGFCGKERGVCDEIHFEGRGSETSAD